MVSSFGLALGVAGNGFIGTLDCLQQQQQNGFALEHASEEMKKKGGDEEEMKEKGGDEGAR